MVRRTLHRDGLYPHHFQGQQNLLLGDSAKCVGVCGCLQLRLENLRDILFADQAQFTWDSITNTRNSQSEAQENPQQLIQCHFERSTFS